MTLPIELGLILACMLSEAFFSGMETGVISVNRLRLLHLVRNGSRGAQILEGFLRETDRLLGTTLVGTNLSMVVVSTLAARTAERHWGNAGQAVAGVVISLVVLVGCEYIPKAWFNSRPLARCIPLAFLLRASEKLLRPLAALVLSVTHWADPRRRKHDSRSPFVTREHLQILARDSEASGQISTFERLMINRVLDLQLQTAADLMMPLERVIRVQPDTSLQACAELVRRHGHLKLPVFDAGNTNCVGVLYMQEVLARSGDLERATAASLMRPPFFLADTLRADDVLPVLRRNRQHLALVRDGQGRVRGIVTVENGLKALMGNLPASATGDRRSAGPATELGRAAGPAAAADPAPTPTEPTR